MKGSNTIQAQRCLIADDYPDAAQSIALLLTLMGHVCTTALGGVEALVLAERHEFDVIILDIGMPDLSGYEVARKLRARFQHSIFLAALTAWDDPSDHRAALAAGFDLHVAKPGDLEKFTRILAAATRKRQCLSERHPPVVARDQRGHVDET